MVRRLAGNKLADCVLDDIADNVLGSVIDATGLANFGFLLDLNTLVRGDDDLAEKAFVDRAEDMNWNGVEVVRRIDVGEILADVCEDVVGHTEAGLVENGVVFEDNAVVNAVEPAARRNEVFPRRAFVAEPVH